MVGRGAGRSPGRGGAVGTKQSEWREKTQRGPDENDSFHNSTKTSRGILIISRGEKRKKKIAKLENRRKPILASSF